MQLHSSVNQEQVYNYRPRITIITVCYNAEKDIEESITSVINQTYDNYEYIIIDGGSNDRTIEMIKRYEDFITCWVSEKDEGIYDAMNKGIDRASGEWLYFLGSDDCLAGENVLSDIVNKLDSSIALAFGDVCYDEGRCFRSRINWRILFTNTVHHQGAFYNSFLFNTFRYNKQLKILGDYDLNLYITNNNYNYIKINRTIAFCKDDGISRQVRWRGYQEEIKIRKKYYPCILFWIFSCYSIFKYCTKKMLQLMRLY